MLTITREFSFDSAHRLHLKELSEEKNLEIFGKCSRFHGHTYRLQITVTGPVQSTGMIINFTDLKQVVTEKIISRYDHICLNDLEEYRDQPPTAENMVRHIFKKLEPCLKKRGLGLTRVQL